MDDSQINIKILQRMLVGRVNAHIRVAKHGLDAVNIIKSDMYAHSDNSDDDSAEKKTKCVCILMDLMVTTCIHIV